MAERNTFRKDGKLIAFLVAAATLIEADKMVAVNAAGHLVEAADAVGITVIGVAAETCDNLVGVAGDLACLVNRKQVFNLKNDATNPVVQASVGSSVYITNSQTVAVIAGPINNIVAGKCLAVGADGVWVEIG